MTKALETLHIGKWFRNDYHYKGSTSVTQLVVRYLSQVWWLVNGQALKVDHFVPDFTESVPIFGTPHDHWHIPKVVHKRWEWV